MIHPPYTEHALSDYYFSLTKQRTCPRTMREVIPVDSCNPVPTWSTFLCNSCSRPVKCQCVAFLAYLKSRHVIRVTQKVCVITSLEREIRKNLYQVFVWRSFGFFKLVYTPETEFCLLGRLYHMVWNCYTCIQNIIQRTCLVTEIRKLTAISVADDRCLSQ